MMKLDGDDNEVMNMVKVPPNQLFRDKWADVVDDQDPGSSSVDFGSDIRRKVELTVTPRCIYLEVTVSIWSTTQ